MDSPDEAVAAFEHPSLIDHPAVWMEPEDNGAPADEEGHIDRDVDVDTEAAGEQWEHLGSGAASADGETASPWGYEDDSAPPLDGDEMERERSTGAEDDDEAAECRELPVMDSLEWDHPVSIVGAMMTGPTTLHICPQCDKVINRYGRLTVCKHTYCASCAVRIQNCTVACWLCAEFRFADPPGATKVKPAVDFFGLDQEMFVCDFVSAEHPSRPCGRGFLSDKSRQACTHEVKTLRQRLATLNDAHAPTHFSGEGRQVRRDGVPTPSDRQGRSRRSSRDGAPVSGHPSSAPIGRPSARGPHAIDRGPPRSYRGADQPPQGRHYVIPRPSGYRDRGLPRHEEYGARPARPPAPKAMPPHDPSAPPPPPRRVRYYF